jgi:hypothetical protein
MRYYLTPSLSSYVSMSSAPLLVNKRISLETLLVNHPLKTEEFIYPTNIFVDENPMTPVPLDRELQRLLVSLPAQPVAIIVTISLFAGYACLFSFQHLIKSSFGIPDDKSAASHSFSLVISSMYISNLIFRICHNFIFSKLSSKIRSLFGLFFMFISIFILYLLNSTNYKNLKLLTIAYAVGGAAVGVFETNYSVVLGALGNKTKIWGISGIPVGIFLIIVPGFILMSLGVPMRYLYLTGTF